MTGFNYYNSNRKIESIRENANVFVRGVAGSGKTTIAINRSLKMIENNYSKMFDNHATIGYFVYNKVLVNHIQDRINKLSNNKKIRNIKVSNIHKLLWGIISEYCKINNLSVECIEKTLSKLFTKKDAKFSFYCEEISWIKSNLINNEEDYLTVPRIGRKSRLTVKDRKIIWELFEKYQNCQKINKTIDFEDYAIIALKYLKDNPEYRINFMHIIIDEFQDFSKSMIAVLKELSKRQCGITFFRDDDQNIYNRNCSLKELGFNVVGNSFVLKENYRNSGHIAFAAKSLIEKNIDDDRIEIQTNNEKLEKPQIVGFKEKHQQYQYVIDNLDYSKPNIILTATNSDADEFIKYCNNSLFTKLDGSDTMTKTKVYVSTIHNAKGLAFDNVYIINVDNDNFQYTDEKGEVSEDLKASRIKLLYTAMTRAKFHLKILYTLVPALILNEIDSDYIDWK